MDLKLQADLTSLCLLRILQVTHAPYRSPPRVTCIKGAFFRSWRRASRSCLLAIPRETFMDKKTLLHDIRDAVATRKIRWSGHTLGRLLERGISRTRVVGAIHHGEVIQSYADDLPFPSVLIAHVDDDPVHVVVGYDEANTEVHVITAYRPDLEHFEEDYKTRRTT